MEKREFRRNKGERMSRRMGTRMRDGMKTAKTAKKGENVRQHSKKRGEKTLAN